MPFTAINARASGGEDAGVADEKGEDKVVAKDVKDEKDEVEVPVPKNEKMDKEAYLKFLTGKYDTLDGPLSLSLKKSTSYLLLRHMVVRKYIREYAADEKGKKFKTFCCHCDRSWGEYDMHNTTTSYLIRHFSIDHPELPKTYAEEDEILHGTKNKDDAATGLEGKGGGKVGPKDGKREEKGGATVELREARGKKKKGGKGSVEPATPTQLGNQDGRTVGAKTRSGKRLRSNTKPSSNPVPGTPAQQTDLKRADDIILTRNRKRKRAETTAQSVALQTAENPFQGAEKGLVTTAENTNPESILPPSPPTKNNSTALTPFTETYRSRLIEFLAMSETSPGVVETKEFHDLIHHFHPNMPKFSFNDLLEDVLARQREVRGSGPEKHDGSLRSKKFEDGLRKEKERRKKKEEQYMAWLFKG